MDWQIDDVIKPAFGTLKPDGTRQYRIVYIEVPKKNGKTELGSGLALYGLVGDGEMGSEVYSAAGDREQATLVYRPASVMVDNNKTLKKRLKIVNSTKRIIDYKTTSYYHVLSAESYTKHGINPHFIIFDEIHAQPNRELWDVLVEGTDTARRQQMIFVLTTAGIHDVNSIGWEVHSYAKDVKEGRIKDPSWLPVIYAAEEDDDWEDKKLWRRVNPALKQIFEIDKLEAHYTQAKNNPARLNNFLRYRLNKWVGQAVRWLRMDFWDACNEKFDQEKLARRICYGGLDLSSTTDLAAFVLLFPPRAENEKWKIIPHFYMPAENLNDKAKRDKVPYDMWTRSGLITATPGNRIDYAFIKSDVMKAYNKYELREVAYDPWNADQFALDLYNNEGIEMVEHRQGYKSMSAPTKELQNFVLDKAFAHGGNPVLRWCADNLVVQVDPAENIKPAKDKATGRIDGIVALIMALGRAVADEDYWKVTERPGVIFL